MRAWGISGRCGQLVELILADGALTQLDGERRWDPISGLGLDGTGQDLGLLPGFTSFPRDYTRFFPNVAVWQPSGAVTVEELLGS